MKKDNKNSKKWIVKLGLGISVGVVILLLISKFPIGQKIGINLINPTVGLRSEFLKNDQTAIMIMSGKPYPLSDEQLIIKNANGISNLNPNNFEFRILNVFKQLGYNRLLDTQSIDETLSTGVLHRFQKNNNLKIQNTIDAETLFKIDNLLYAREQEDKKLAQLYPPTTKFSESPFFEPSNNHLAMLYYSFFSTLPPQTTRQVLTVDDFRYGLIYGLGRNLGVMMDKDGKRVLSQSEAVDVINAKSDFKFCSDPYYVSIDLENGTLCGRHKLDLIPGYLSFMDDYGYMETIWHEYGHVQGVYALVKGDEKTRPEYAFGKISFDMSSVDYNNQMNSAKLLRSSSNIGEFVTMYAMSMNQEDFAETYTAYVIAGKIFRLRAKQNKYLQQKYDFMKDKVFYGREYNTGSIGSYEKWLKNNPNQIPISNPHLYMYLDYDWVWDYQYPEYAPDLVIESINVKQINHNQMLIGFDVANRGPKTTSSIQAVFTYKAGADLRLHSSNTCTKNTILNYNEKCRSANILTFGGIGKRVLTVEVDPMKLIKESNEENNTASIKIDIIP